jgi:hypothetical protein
LSLIVHPSCEVHVPRLHPAGYRYRFPPLSARSSSFPAFFSPTRQSKLQCIPAHADPYLLFCRSRLPYTQNTYGNGAMISVKQPSNVVAQWKLSVSYIWTPKRGKAAANELRANEFADSAEAAYRGYASTRNVKILVYTRMIPQPKNDVPMIGTIQWTAAVSLLRLLHHFAMTYHWDRSSTQTKTDRRQ